MNDDFDMYRDRGYDDRDYERDDEDLSAADPANQGNQGSQESVGNRSGQGDMERAGREQMEGQAQNFGGREQQGDDMLDDPDDLDDNRDY